MRRSGSSSCMLRPRSCIDLTEDASDEPLSVTLINTQHLPTYSAERFYMLSELELKAHSTLFLCDHDDCDQTQDTADSSEVSFEPNAHHHHHLSNSSISATPLFAILYLLWRPETVSGARAFADGPITSSLKECKNLVETGGHSLSNHHVSVDEGDNSADRTKIYLVVDTFVESSLLVNIENRDLDEDARQRRFQVQVILAEQLARHVARSLTLRNAVEGITVGVTDHVRAAPGLEACLEAIAVGSRDRRRHKDDKSLIGIVAKHPDELIGLQEETVTDAAQGVLQSRTCAEWNGHGNLQSFARRAHAVWCTQHDVREESKPVYKRRSPRRLASNKAEDDDDDDGDVPLDLADPLSSLMVIFVLGYMASYMWKMYGDTLQRFLSTLDYTNGNHDNDVQPNVI